jgi:hypothetical protein
VSTYLGTTFLLTHTIHPKKAGEEEGHQLPTAQNGKGELETKASRAWGIENRKKLPNPHHGAQLLPGELQERRGMGCSQSPQGCSCCTMRALRLTQAGVAREEE